MSNDRVRLTIFGGVANEHTRPEDLGEYLDPEREVMIADLIFKPGESPFLGSPPWEEDSKS